jgi:hypothetical protein
MFMFGRQLCARRIALASTLLLCLTSGFALARAQKAPVPATPQPTGNCTHPDPATRPDCPAAIAFLAKFQDALKRNDRPAVASLVHYPLLVTDGGRKQIHSRAELLGKFNSIFNASVRAAILNATPDDVWGNYRGFMIGRGVIWFDGIIPPNAHPDPSAPDDGKKYPFKLITVNPAYP